MAQCISFLFAQLAVDYVNGLIIVKSIWKIMSSLPSYVTTHTGTRTTG